jgi:thiol-disulfide isomerase/thioredoxin
MTKNAKKAGLAEELKDKDLALVLFYATWCPFSRRFLPHFEAYAEAHPDECRIVKADDDPAVCDEYGVEVYPTVLSFKNGKLHQRLDGIPGVGLSQRQLDDFCRKPV